MKRKATITELEKILNSEDTGEIYIRPDGSITSRKRKGEKVLTIKENLGGDY